MSTTPASQILAAQGVPHFEFKHPGPVHSLEQAAAERNQIPQQVVRSIVLRLDADECALALVAGPQQMDWKALRRYYGRSRLTMAAPEEVLAVTGFEIGAVGPFGLKTPLPIVLDESLSRQTEVSIGSGLRGTAVILAVADLLTALGNPPVAILTNTVSSE